MQSEERNSIADDLLNGADQIAIFLFGSARNRRRIYHLAETSRLPVFKLGTIICARKSTLLGWIARQESNVVVVTPDETHSGRAD